MSEVYTRFQTLTAQKTLPFGAAHAYMAFIGEYPPPPQGRGELYTIKHALLIFYLFPKTQVCFLFIYTLVWREGVSRHPASPVSSPSLFSRLLDFSPFPIAKYCAFLHQRLLTFKRVFFLKHTFAFIV